jgi:hypothetical protein
VFSGRINAMKLAFYSESLGWLAGLTVAVALVSASVAQSDVHGRKWKPLPATSHIVVTVVKGFNGKPLQNAAVVFHAVRDGKNDGNLEVKTDEDGKATIDVIEVGSHLTVQVIANGFATSATEMDVDTDAKLLQVRMLRPRAQVSDYVDNDGKAAPEKPGIQEPAHQLTPAVKTTAPVAPTAPATDPTKPTVVPGPPAASGSTPPPATAPVAPPPGPAAPLPGPAALLPAGDGQ